MVLSTRPAYRLAMCCGPLPGLPPPPPPPLPGCPAGRPAPPIAYVTPLGRAPDPSSHAQPHRPLLPVLFRTCRSRRTIQRHPPHAFRLTIDGRGLGHVVEAVRDDVGVQRAAGRGDQAPVPQSIRSVNRRVRAAPVFPSTATTPALKLDSDGGLLPRGAHGTRERAHTARGMPQPRLAV